MTNQQLTITAIVLAGGKSSRMGRDKALISIRGVSLLQHICNAARDCAAEVYVVTPWPERYQDILPSNCFLIREVPSSGEGKPHGPLLGFAQGLSAVLSEKNKDASANSTTPGEYPALRAGTGAPPLQHSGWAQGHRPYNNHWVLLLACDLPRLHGSVLQSWTEQLDLVPENAIAFLPRHAKGWEPLCGFYRIGCLPILTEFINQGGRSFQQWLKQHNVQELPLTEPELLFNCNTPADLAVLD